MHQPRECAISIHAPREGSDEGRSAYRPWPRHFYPRSPRGERHPSLNQWDERSRFLSTLPARGATGLLEAASPFSGDFYPRSPRGERQQTLFITFTYDDISIHAPREGSDRGNRRGRRNHHQFLSTLPARGATEGFLKKGKTVLHFYPRSPRGERPGRALFFCMGGDFYPRSPRGERR